MSKKSKITYTHIDSSGMPWRFSGSRPVSKLADLVMQDCGLPLRPNPRRARTLKKKS
jgi:hypothetical protein